jgi:hypothetical protein
MNRSIDLCKRPTPLVRSLVGSLLVGAMALGLAGCRDSTKPADAPSADETANAGPGWTIEEVATIEGFAAPESCAVDPATGNVYVSNMEVDRTEEDLAKRYWSDDGKAFISKLGPDGKILELKWHDSALADQLHSPKGMMIHDGTLYINDNSRVVQVELADETGTPVVNTLEDAKTLNDICYDGESFWVSDTTRAKILKTSLKSEGVTTIDAPTMINGLTWDGDMLYGVCFDTGEVYRIDPTGEKAPEPLGVADEIQGADGIEALEDHTLLVTDFAGAALRHVDPKTKVVTTLWKMEPSDTASVADPGFNRKTGMLYIPSVLGDTVTVLKLTRTPTSDEASK